MNEEKEEETEETAAITGSLPSTLPTQQAARTRLDGRTIVDVASAPDEEVHDEHGFDGGDAENGSKRQAPSMLRPSHSLQEHSEAVSAAESSEVSNSSKEGRAALAQARQALRLKQALRKQQELRWSQENLVKPL
jgi:hypothetical protein